MLFVSHGFSKHNISNVYVTYTHILHIIVEYITLIIKKPRNEPTNPFIEIHTQGKKIKFKQQK